MARELILVPRRRRPSWLSVLAVSLPLMACQDPHPRAQPSPSATVAEPLPAPSASFSLPEHHGPSGAVRRPPETALLDAWVFVKQTRPRPKKNPRWQHVPARSPGSVDMPEGSTWRCLVAPVALAPIEGDEGDDLVGWIATRSVRCTSDGWRSFAEGAHVVRVLEGGRREPVNPQGEVHLRERRDGADVEISVVLRSENPRREPTHGGAFARRQAGAEPSGRPKETRNEASKKPTTTR